MAVTYGKEYVKEPIGVFKILEIIVMTTTMIFLFVGVKCFHSYSNYYGYPKNSIPQICVGLGISLLILIFSLWETVAKELDCVLKFLFILLAAVGVWIMVSTLIMTDYYQTSITLATAIIGCFGGGLYVVDAAISFKANQVTSLLIREPPVSTAHDRRHWFNERCELLKNEGMVTYGKEFRKEAISKLKILEIICMLVAIILIDMSDESPYRTVYRRFPKKTYYFDNPRHCLPPAILGLVIALLTLICSFWQPVGESLDGVLKFQFIPLVLVGAWILPDAVLTIVHFPGILAVVGAGFCCAAGVLCLVEAIVCIKAYEIC